MSDDARDVPEFADGRSKKVIIVAHCALNQNARIDSCALSPAVVPGLVEALVARQIGIIQYPCPELGFLGMCRRGQDCRSWDGSYRHPAGEVYDQMTVPAGRVFLRGIARNLIQQVREYRNVGFTVLGVLGVPMSPTCGVGTTYYQGMRQSNGAFIEELITALAAAGIDLPIRGLHELEPERNPHLIDELEQLAR